MVNRGWTKVSQHWDENEETKQTTARKWEQVLPTTWEIEDQTEMETQLQEEQIALKECKDILRWGRKGNGNLKVKQAYKSVAGVDTIARRQIWDRIWNPNLCPKISSFLWLVARKKVLTWDHLVRRGYEGPSFCMICRVKRETRSHFFYERGRQSGKMAIIHIT